MKSLLRLLFAAFPMILSAQDPEGFDKMAKNMAANKAPIIFLDSIERWADYLILDAREKKEYEVSHIPNAVWVGYDDFDLERIPSTDKPIIVYCSVGYRSGKIAEKIEKETGQNALNLYGGIFHYANSGLPLENLNQESTKHVHGYNKNWSKWLNSSKCTPKL